MASSGESKFILDPTKNQIVIVAGRRAERPRLTSAKKDEKPACPFCPGNEFMTPPTRFALPNAKAWKTRVFENAFPALKPKGKFSKIPGPGFGEHEVIVETPKEGGLFQDFGEEQLKIVFRTYVETVKRLEKRKGVKNVFLIKNHGLAGGASIPHEHAQVFALPFVPPLVETENSFFNSFKRKTGKCFYCSLVKSQPKLWENSFASVIAPEFARFGFELWVIPKKHCAGLKELSEKEGVLLLKAIQECVRRTYGIVQAYNFVFHETGHLHVEFYPRKTVWAGLELGSGVVINSRTQKDVLAQLKKAP